MLNAQVPADGEPTGDNPAQCVRLARLKDGLSQEKRAFAEDLRRVFLLLGVGVRRYAARRHLDASSVTRYLSGERVPPWDFVAGVIADVREEARAPLTAEVEQALRELHRAAQQTNRRRSEVQVLQDRLEEADAESRRIKTRQRALEETLQDREGWLARAQARCQNFEVRLEEQRPAHRAELEVWRGEYRRLGNVCSDLQDEVAGLQQELARARTELIEAEERCHLLEAELEAAHALDREGADRIEPPSLMVMLEEADRSASVPELVRVVGDLELRTRQATAGELVRSASQSRTIEEVAGLLAALRQAGFDAHAQAALPAMVMVRSVADTSALTRSLFHEGFEDYVLTLLQASVEFHRADDVSAFALALHRDGLTEHATSLLGAVAAVRPVDDLVSLTRSLVGGALDSALMAALSTAAARREVPDLAALSLALRENGLPRLAKALQLAAVAQRSASDVVRFVDSLKGVGLDRDAEKVYDNMQRRGVRHLLALVYVLLQERRHHDTWSLLLRAAQTRSGHEIAALITNLYSAGRHQYAAELLILTVRSRAAAEVRTLIGVLDERAPGAQTLIRTAARNSPPRGSATLLTCLARRELPVHAEAVFLYTLSDQNVRHLGEFLSALAAARSPYVERVSLCERARAASTSVAARLLLALDSASLSGQLVAVAETLGEEWSVQDVTRLIVDLESLDNPLKPLSWSVTRHLLHHLVGARSTTDLAAMACAFEVTDRFRPAEYLNSRAESVHGRRFRDELKKERTRYERKGVPLPPVFPLGVPVDPTPAQSAH
ncbi:ATP/GTP-binding protein [Streptomyces sp. NPDC005492]|uniref:ATP/GTP-binding protein n=1 Tax=Streptomyces sp. NPDC005492 TaxID=3156883 RepID=UPI0033A80994